MTDVGILHCSACLEKKSLVRILKCQHELCESCCKINFRKDLTADNLGHIICPVEREFTVLANGLNDIKELKKRISMDLTCDNCSNNYRMQNFWWCNDCAEAVCSWCAMQNHRSHDCSAWHEERIVQECLQLLSPFSKCLSKDVEKEIDQFCLNLSTELKSRLSVFEEATIFADSVKRIFGSKPHAAIVFTVAGNQQRAMVKIDKKLHLLNVILSSIDQDMAFDVEKLTELFKSEPGKELHFPSVDFVADLFFKNCRGERNDSAITTAVSSVVESVLDENCKYENPSSVDSAVGQKQVFCSASTPDEKPKCELPTNSIASSSGQKPVLSAVSNLVQKPVSYAAVAKTEQCAHPLSTIQAPFLQKDPAELTWNMYLKDGFKNPSKVCAIPHVGVIVVDDLGVHLLSETLHYQKYKGWPTPSAQHNSAIPTVAYHAKHESVFVLREVPNNRHVDAKKIIELKIPLLVRLSATVYPDFLDTDNRLLGVSKKGNLICASSSKIWMKSLDLPNFSAFIWHRSTTEKFEPFKELVVGPLLNSNTESFYFMGIKTVYIFAYAYGISCRLLQCINTPGPSILSFTDIVYTSNNDQTMMFPIGDSNQRAFCLKIQPVNHISVKNIVMSSDDISVYLLNCDTNNLYSGKVCVY